MIKQGDKYLVTTDCWFIAPDGEQYRSAWGKCELKTTEEVFGFSPSKPSTNWFLFIGNMIIAGCQIHYVVKCDNKPTIKTELYADKDTGVQQIANRIYIAE